MINNRPVCHGLGGKEEATVVCRMMGYPSAVDVDCKGDENHLLECAYNYGKERMMIGWNDGKKCRLDAGGVFCLDNSTLTIELRGGADSSEGNLYLNNMPVCHNSWGNKEAAVVCHMLGFRFGVPY